MLNKIQFANKTIKGKKQAKEVTKWGWQAVSARQTRNTDKLEEEEWRHGHQQQELWLAHKNGNVWLYHDNRADHERKC